MASTQAFSQLHYGVQVSANLSNADIKSSDVSKLTKDMKALSGATLIGEYNITKNVSVRTSLGLLQKGVKVAGISNGTDAPANISSSINTTLNYLEMPWNFVYNIHFKSAKLMIGAGPSFGLGISGKAKTMFTDPANPSTKHSEEVDAFKDEKDGGVGFKKFDASANALVGVGFKKGLYFTASYLYGLSNLSSENEYKNRGIQLSLGFMFR
jgi:hypothetical protein